MMKFSIIIITAVVMISLFLTLVVISLPDHPLAATEPSCYHMDGETREKIRAITLAALDDSLKHHIEHLFQVWMRDDHGQPARAKVGFNNGLKAYLDARAKMIAWNPQLC